VAEETSPRGGPASRDDELLDDPPDTDHHLGRIAGYRRGSRARTAVFLTLALSVPAAALLGRWYAKRLDEDLHRPSPAYELAPNETGKGRTREVSWSTGRARLGLSREPPGVEQIRLPDRILRLAEGHDHAQVRVEVREGKTVQIEVIAGQIEEELLTAP
jgi:hypothetical protein